METLTVGKVKQFINEQESLGNISDDTVVVIVPSGTPIYELSGICTETFEGKTALGLDLLGDVF